MNTQRLYQHFALLLFFSSTAVAGTSNSLMDIYADGTLLICSNRDSGTVSVLDIQSGEVLREITVGKHPEGVSFDAS